MGKRKNPEKAGGDSAPASSLSAQAEAAADHFDQFGDGLSRPYDSVHVTEDLVVFPGTAKGTNDCDNYCRGKGVKAQHFNFQPE